MPLHKNYFNPISPTKPATFVNVICSSKCVFLVEATEYILLFSYSFGRSCIYGLVLRTVNIFNIPLICVLLSLSNSTVLFGKGELIRSLNCLNFWLNQSLLREFLAFYLTYFLCLWLEST